MNAKLMLVGLASLMALTPLGTVSGQDWTYGSPYSSAGWGFAWPTSCYAAEALPYFSVFPPVYYSHRVPRPFGYSPFAYPPGVLTPCSEPPQAVAQNASRMPDGAEAARQGRPPLRINNPFVGPPSPPGLTTNRRPPARQPKVIYPAAMARRGSESLRGS
jgi:hypothetical protein